MRRNKNKRVVVLSVLVCGCLYLTTTGNMAFAANNLEPEDNSSYDMGEDESAASEEEGTEEENKEDMTGKIVIAVRKPTAFRVYSKKEGVFIVRAKNKGEISGYDIHVNREDWDKPRIYKARTEKSLFRRFIGAKADQHYKVKVRTFRTINGKEYPSRWTKELQVIVWPRSEDGIPSGTTLHELGRDKTNGSVNENGANNTQ